MESLIYENFKFGNYVEVIFKGFPVPLEGKFIKISHGAILLKSASGKKMVISVNDILMIRQGSIPGVQPSNNSAAPESNFSRGRTFTPSTGNTPTPPEETVNDSNNIESESQEPADKNSEEEEADPIATNSSLYKLPSEAPQLKILGTIELDDADKNRRRFKSSLEEVGKPVELAENFRDTVMTAQGILKSIGPVYGYIQVPDGMDIYCNRGEFIFKPGDEAEPYQGMPVCFTLGSNWKGTMAKCIHRPFTVGEQIDLIDHIMDTDMRNARLLGRQLSEAFPDNEEIADALEILPQF
ncbi:MAG: hypothetical protein K2N03_02980 [Muribaculaceae bacterium]|nr:hypothetical protein [Muribaculaceae bacterium]